MAITISIKNCHALAFRSRAYVNSQLDSFLAASAELNLEIDVCEIELVDAAYLEKFALKIGFPTSNAEVKTVLLCGGYLEQQISLAAHYLLVVGFRVLLLRDLIQVKDRAQTEAQFHDLRLTQSGALLTTLDQIVYEWLATETDERVRNALMRLSAN